MEDGTGFGERVGTEIVSRVRRVARGAPDIVVVAERIDRRGARRVALLNLGEHPRDFVVQLVAMSLLQRDVNLSSSVRNEVVRRKGAYETASERFDVFVGRTLNESTLDHFLERHQDL